MKDFLETIRWLAMSALFAGCVLFVIHLLTKPRMLNDPDTQAKRILLWQELLTEISAEERQLIESDPKGWAAKEAAQIVQTRLAAWQRKRDRDAG